jgi:hypothetical protein
MTHRLNLTLLGFIAMLAAGVPLTGMAISDYPGGAKGSLGLDDRPPYREYLLFAALGQALSGATGGSAGGAGDSGSPWIFYNEDGASGPVSSGNLAAGEGVTSGLWATTTENPSSSGPDSGDPDGAANSELLSGDPTDLTGAGVGVPDPAGTLALLAVGYASVVVFARLRRINPTVLASS